MAHLLSSSVRTLLRKVSNYLTAPYFCALLASRERKDSAEEFDRAEQFESKF